ncbi:MAG: hypothetical protein ACO39U_08160, partial [Bacteroidia bacterium]
MTRFNRLDYLLTPGQGLLVVLFWAGLLAHNSVNAQTPSAGRPMELPAYIDSNGDTVPVAFLPHIEVRDRRIFRSAADKKRFDRLYWNVMKVYPLA